MAQTLLRSPKTVGPFNPTLPPDSNQVTRLFNEVEQLRQVVIDMYNILTTTGEKSTLNSSETALGGSETFTGTWETNDYPHAFVMSKSDVAGTLYFDFSNDGGTTLHSTYPVAGFNCSAGIPEVHTAVKAARSFRVRYVNGSAAQTTLSLGLYYGFFGDLKASVNNAISLDSDATVVRDGTNLFDISKGLVTGRANETKFGYNDSVGTSEEAIWFNGGAYNFLTTADELRIKSGGNTNDTAAGSGARAVVVVYLDENWEEQSETLATAGTSASSTTSGTAIRFLRAYVDTVGTYGAGNTGNIVIETEGGTTVGSIEAGFGQSQLCVYAVPAGKVAYLYAWEAEVDSTKTANVFLNQRRNADDVTTPFQGKRIIRRYSGLAGVGAPKKIPYLAIPAKTDIWVSAIGPSGGAAVNSAFHFILEDVA